MPVILFYSGHDRLRFLLSSMGRPSWWSLLALAATYISGVVLRHKVTKMVREK